MGKVRRPAPLTNCPVATDRPAGDWAAKVLALGVSVRLEFIARIATSSFPRKEYP